MRGNVTPFPVTLSGEWQIRRPAWRYTARMQRLLLVACAALLALGAVAGEAPRAETPFAAPGAPSWAALLRYTGRDPATGLATPVDDRFIAAVEESYARYGKDEREPVPPPARQGDDIATLHVPRLGGDLPVRRMGLDAFGRLDVPADARTVGWHPAYSTLPGEGGAAFFAAHYEFGGVPGVFARLAEMQPGDIVTVATAGGAVVAYRVTSVVDYPLEAIDMGALLAGRLGVESIVLMTCSGPPSEGEYPLRTVVLAERVA